MKPLLTREEEIEKQGTTYSDIASNYIEWGDGFEDYDDREYVERAFIEGAKWADNNPKEGLVDINKAREWVKNAFVGPFGEGMANNIADEFVKAMEE